MLCWVFKIIFTLYNTSLNGFQIDMIYIYIYIYDIFVLCLDLERGLSVQ